MNKARDTQLQNMQRNKIAENQKKAALDQQERIRLREQEMFEKRHLLKVKKDDEKLVREERIAMKATKLKEKYKVESKLHVETKAMQEKKREKFDKEKDSARDPLTMGGLLPGQQMRAIPNWRAGIWSINFT